MVSLGSIFRNIWSKPGHHDQLEGTTPFNSFLLNPNGQVLRTTVIQVLLRLFVSGTRFLVYVLIARLMGIYRLGEYSVILSYLVFFEIMTDFGMSDIYVREVCSHTERSNLLITNLIYLKIPMVVFCYLLLACSMLAFNYSVAVRQGAMIAGLGFVFYGGIHCFRGLFKATLNIEKDVAGEAAGSFIFLLMLTYLCLNQGTLLQICWALVISRIIYFSVNWLLGKNIVKIKFGRPDRRIMVSLFISALPLGLSMLIVILILRLDILLIERLDSTYAAGLYTTAFAYTTPLLIVPHSLMQAFFPVISNYWEHTPDKVGPAFQTAIDWTATFGGGILVTILVSSRFLVSIFHPDAVEAASAFRILSVAIFFMFINAIVGPMLVICRRIWLGFSFAVFMLLFNLSADLLLIPKFSFVGAATAKVITEVTNLTIVLFAVQRIIHYRINWSIFLEIGSIGALSLLVISGLGLWDKPLGGLASMLLYFLGCVLVKTSNVKELLAFMRK